MIPQTAARPTASAPSTRQIRRSESEERGKLPLPRSPKLRQAARTKGPEGRSPNYNLGKNLAKLAKEEMAVRTGSKSDIERVLNTPINRITKTEPQIVWQMAKTAYFSRKVSANDNLKASQTNALNQQKTSKAGKVTGPDGFIGLPETAGKSKGNKAASPEYISVNDAKKELPRQITQSRSPLRARQDSHNIHSEANAGTSTRMLQLGSIGRPIVIVMVIRYKS